MSGLQGYSYILSIHRFVAILGTFQDDLRPVTPFLDHPWGRGIKGDLNLVYSWTY